MMNNKSSTCPLCGNPKPEAALFCDTCARKVREEYEVDIPEKEKEPEDIFGKKKDTGKMEKSAPEIKKIEVEPQDAPKENLDLETKMRDSKPEEKKRRKGSSLLIVLLLVVLGVGAFWFYNETIRKENVDRGDWEEAVKLNTAKGFLAYMEVHPEGAHFDDAQERLLRLKTEEALEWEKMKRTDNASELNDFAERYPSSPYLPLVKARLDSLLWISTLEINTAGAYDDYIVKAKNGLIKGDYVSQAARRHQLLASPDLPADVPEDTIRAVVDGFFHSLSMLDHNGLSRYLAPKVRRFFGSGSASRERVTGELVMTGAKAMDGTLLFMPDLSSLRCEPSGQEWDVNVPLMKSYRQDGVTKEVYGYIVHLSLDPYFQIVSVYETKPYPEAP